MRHRVAALVKSSGDPSLDETIWAETLAEQQAGWLRGPFSADELSLKHPSGWLAAKRFGLVQGDKVRLIDDYSLPQTNAGYSTAERLTLDDVDAVAALSKLFMLRARAASFPLALHGKCLDLAAAYRQIAVAPQSAWVSNVAVYNPSTSQPSFFEQVALPFGAVASVHIFNRLARAVWSVGAHLLGLVWLCFFDDFPVLEAVGSLGSALAAAECLFSTLGWKLSSSPEKQLPFQEVFAVLGVEVDFRQCRAGQLYVQNKPSRVTQLQAITTAILESHTLTAREAASLKGKFAYAEGQCFGRAAKVALRVIGSRSHQVGKDASLTPELAAAIAWLAEHVLRCKPRCIPMCDDRLPALLFTDGCYEPPSSSSAGIAACGAVLVLDGVCTERFGEAIPACLLARWL